MDKFESLVDEEFVDMLLTVLTLIQIPVLSSGFAPVDYVKNFPF